MNHGKKPTVTLPGIDPGTVRLVAQRLNHYATPGPIYQEVERQNVHGFSVCEHRCVNKKDRKKKNLFLLEMWYSHCRSIGGRGLSRNVSVIGYVVNPIHNMLLYPTRGRRVDKATRSLVVESGHLSKQCDGWRHLSDAENSLSVKGQA